jgi:hypothetical protein
MFDLFTDDRYRIASIARAGRQSCQSSSEGNMDTVNKEDSMSKPRQEDNGDKHLKIKIGDDTVVGIGNFHKTLPHNPFGEVDGAAFDQLLEATLSMDGGKFQGLPIPQHEVRVAPFANPRCGLADDRLVPDPASFYMPPAPAVLSETTAAEMTELYWMALLRDMPFNAMAADPLVKTATDEINTVFCRAIDLAGARADALRPGIDVPGAPDAIQDFTPDTLFRLGLPGEMIGPMVSQFFVRPISFGTQTIDPQQRPYKSGRDYLEAFPDWLKAQNTGIDRDGQDYPNANEDSAGYYEATPRYISTMRDLARFVNKDALHQAYFNAALLLLNGKADWTRGNPYRVNKREAGFGVLGGPHILALVSEVATRALKVVWHQKWQVHLRLRPEAYGGLAHVQKVGAFNPLSCQVEQRAYGLPSFLFDTEAARRVHSRKGGYLLPLAFGPGSPTHPAYGAGHATVAGACVTVLKAFFETTEERDGTEVPIPFVRLLERDTSYGRKCPMKAYLTGCRDGAWERMELGLHLSGQLTIEGELNKLAQNVAMGRSMGGVHWRTDNARSLVLGEAIAAGILRDIAKDVREHPTFRFRTFERGVDGQPRNVTITKDDIMVDGKKVDNMSALVHGAATSTAT